MWQLNAPCRSNSTPAWASLDTANGPFSSKEERDSLQQGTGKPGAVDKDMASMLVSVSQYMAFHFVCLQTKL